MAGADTELQSLKRLEDPKYFGSGVWFCIHTVAAQVKTYNDLVQAIKHIEGIIDNLKCGKCRHHAHEYLRKHPLKQCLDCKHTAHKGGIARCLFHWTVDFHNTVNAFLGKPIIGYDLAYTFYSEPTFEVCNTDCGSDKTEGDKHEAKFVPNGVTYFSKGLRLGPR